MGGAWVLVCRLDCVLVKNECIFLPILFYFLAMLLHRNLNKTCSCFRPYTPSRRRRQKISLDGHATRFSPPSPPFRIQKERVFFIINQQQNWREKMRQGSASTCAEQQQVGGGKIDAFDSCTRRYPFSSSSFLGQDWVLCNRQSVRTPPQSFPARWFWG